MDNNYRDLLKQCDLILKRGYGIELEWGEKAILRNYIRSFHKVRGIVSSDYMLEGLHSFMREFFGLNMHEISAWPRRELFPDGVIRDTDGGNKWWGTPEFKTYCRDRIKMWRDERDLV